MLKIILSLLAFLFILECNTAAFAKKHHKTQYHSTKNQKIVHKKRISSKKRAAINALIDTGPAKNPLKSVFITSHSIPTSKGQESLRSIDDLNLETITSFKDSKQHLDNSSVPFDIIFGQVDWPTISKRMYLKKGKIFSSYKGYTLELTLDPNLQEASQRYLNSNGIRNGATAIIDPKTGKILALTQNQGNNNILTPLTSKAPAASLIKFVTASAAIEKQNLSPEDEIHFRGSCHSLPRNENWIANPARDTEKITLAMAFGSSCNAVFARLAVYDAGLAELKNYANKFMFNQPIPSDVKIQTSMFLLPDVRTATTQEVAEAGSGFGAAQITPIHSALLSATVENNGIMMAPYLIAAAFDNAGKTVYKATPRQIGQVIQPKTAKKLETLMLATISHGTSRRAFSRKGTRNEVDEIGGKTGTLLDLENRDLLYTLFSGVAPLNSPNSIAIGTVIASPQNLIVRASSVAQTTLAEFLKLEKAKAE
jgi:cell division protein FtsI/penicillin-binding protein 2